MQTSHPHREGLELKNSTQKHEAPVNCCATLKENNTYYYLRKNAKQGAFGDLGPHEGIPYWVPKPHQPNPIMLQISSVTQGLLEMS